MEFVGLGLTVFLLAFGAILAYARGRWRAETAELVEALNDRQDLEPSSVPPGGLPDPVRRYFQAVLPEEHADMTRPLDVRGAVLSQEGSFLVRPAAQRWGPFQATQYIHCAHPGFIWDAIIRMVPGVLVRVRDGFVNESGSMQAQVFGIVTLVSLRDRPELSEAALQRYLAEAVWCPVALLPAWGVHWEPVDDSSARATLSVSDTTASLEFSFDALGLVERVYTPRRWREVDGAFEATPWEGCFSDYQEVDGMKVPLASEVAWQLPDGPQPYWRGRITRAQYFGTRNA